MQPDTVGTAPAFRCDHFLRALAVVRMVLLSDRQSIWKWADETAKQLDVPFQAVLNRLIRAVVHGDLKAEFDPLLGSLDNWRGQLKTTLIVGLNSDIRTNNATGFYLQFVMVHRIDFDEWFRQYNKNSPVTIAGARKRGRKAEKRDKVEHLMRKDLRENKLTTKQLHDMKEEALAALYKASRDTCRTARAAVLSESEFVEKPPDRISDK